MQTETVGFSTTGGIKKTASESRGLTTDAVGMRELDLYKGLKVLLGEMAKPLLDMGFMDGLLFSLRQAAVFSV